MINFSVLLFEKNNCKDYSATFAISKFKFSLFKFSHNFHQIYLYIPPGSYQIQPLFPPSLGGADGESLLLCHCVMQTCAVRSDRPWHVWALSAVPWCPAEP